jgi:hypothetical protein
LSRGSPIIEHLENDPRSLIRRFAAIIGRALEEVGQHLEEWSWSYK